MEDKAEQDRPPPIARSTSISKVPTDQLGIATLYEGRNIKVDVVAFHGLGAIPEITWKEKTSGVNWLKDDGMLPAAIPNSRIMRFGYDSMYLSREPVRTSIDIIANNLLAHVVRERRDCNSRQIIFIAHCFGGLVVEKALVTDHLATRQTKTKSLLDVTSGIIFLGTPHSGTGTFTSKGIPAEAILSVISKYTELGLEAQVLSDLERQGGALLDISKQFLSLCPSPESYPRIVNFFEMRISKIGKQLGRDELEEFVVDEASAAMGSHPSLGLPLDHFSLNKFASPEDGNYKAIRNQIEELYDDSLRRSSVAKCADDGAASANVLPDRPARSLSPINDAPVDRMSCAFTGRDPELEAIGTAFERHTGLEPARYAIWGMPGLGKSQLALKYAYLSFRSGRYSHVFWISATTTEKLHQGLENVLNVVSHPDRHHPDPAVRLSAARFVLENPEQYGCLRWLLILDNAMDGVVSFLRDHLPRQNTHGAILITTRTLDVADCLSSTAGQQHPNYKLQPLSAAQSAILLLKRAGLYGCNAPDIESEAEELVKQTGCLPLAVDQAGSFMKRSHMGVHDIRTLYRDKELEQVIRWENSLTTYEERSVLATFTMQFQRLEEISPDASELLKTLSFFDPENIPLDILAIGADRTRRLVMWATKDSKRGSVLELIGSKWRMRRALQHLEDLSLIQQQRRGEKQSLHIHDLIQFVLQQFVVSSEYDYYALSVTLLSNAFQAIKDVESPECWPECERYIAHFVSLTKSGRTRAASNRELLNASHSLANYLTSRGRYKEAEESYAWALKGREKQLGLEHSDTLTTVRGLAGLYRLQGKYDKAEKSFSRVLASDERHLGMEHPATLATAHGLAGLYKTQGRFQEAEKLYARVLAGAEKQLGVEDPDTLATMHSLAGLYQRQGKYVEAEKLYTRVLAGYEKGLGMEHPSTLATVHDWARLCETQRRYDEAEKQYARVLAGQEKQLGMEHPNTLATVHNLAGLYKTQRKYHDAEMMYSRVLAGDEKRLGPEHPDTLTTVHGLASLYKSQGKYEEAEKLYARVLAGDKKHLGLDHPSTLTTMHNLARLYKTQRKYDEAEKLYVRALAGREKQLGAEHPTTLTTVHALAILYEIKGRYQDAEKLYVRVLSGEEKRLGLEHPDTLMTVYSLGYIQVQLRRYGEAEAMYKRALAGRERKLGLSHPDTLKTKENLADLYERQGRQEEAKLLRQGLSGNGG